MVKVLRNRMQARKAVRPGVTPAVQENITVPETGNPSTQSDYLRTHDNISMEKARELVKKNAQMHNWTGHDGEGKPHAIVEAGEGQPGDDDWRKNVYTVTEDELLPKDEPKPQPVQPQPVQQVDTASRWAKLLGKSPEEKAKEEDARRRSSAKRQMWGHFFDGLRYLGAMAAGGRNVPVMQFNSLGEIQKKNFEERQARQDKLDADQQAYRMKIYQIEQAEKEKAEAKAEKAEAKVDKAKKDKLEEALGMAKLDALGYTLEGKKLSNEGKKTDNAIKEKKLDALGYTLEGKKLSNEGKKTDNAIKKKKLENLPQEQADKHATAQHNANRPYSTGRGGGGSGGKGSGNGVYAELQALYTKYPEDVPSQRYVPKTEKAARELIARIKAKHAKDTGGGYSNYVKKHKKG